MYSEVYSRGCIFVKADNLVKFVKMKSCEN